MEASRWSHALVTDVQEVSASSGHDADADLYVALAPELIRFATGLVGPTDAADILSTAVLKALSSPSWPTVANRRAYLYRAVFNAAQTHRRRQSLRPDREGRAQRAGTYYLPELHPEVSAAVLALSVRQRAVIILTYWSDLDPASVAERIGTSEGSVRRHLARARARLRKALHA